ncbi:MAG: glycosyltransferase family 4 protein [Bryobacteraceae bacterium]|nr:glycosyltransferase family 4 protein [Bryobacteraceae bacterium]
MPIALDATYSHGSELSGIGVYSREMLWGLASAYPDTHFRFCYRPHRWTRSLSDRLPTNASRALFDERWMLPPGADLFHGLNQRLPSFRFRRSVCTFHDLFVMTGEYSSPEFRARFTTQARAAAERCDLIVTVSAFTASQVEDLLGVEPSRIRVVHHGITSVCADAHKREPMILHVGAIQHRKNIVRLLRAFEQTGPEWRLVLAGSPNGYGAESVLAAIDSSPARERIELTGYISRDRLDALYSRASIFAFPSLDEGFGMPVLEAMAHGVPVLSSARSALPEVCGDAAILVDPCSEQEITEALLRLTKSPELRQDYVSRGQERAAGFSWSEAIRKTWQVYSELLD